ncbi:MAG: nitroreductase [Nitrospirae bacterium]|nr:nitroreductase [Nitrospirota bacterium]MBU6480969.1 nitroreductase [Nitrospirota bacterium]MDE3041279.1 nitroreductase [Nitrospirota bacterium]MDE3049126.1 nitroreductase [Nitrospirota bacterium]MDE3218367.1 nitroreductase [Nitrospirota bacterium]
MDLMDAIYSRRSVRSYTDQQVEKPVVESLIQAAVQAPSALNQQPWAFAVVQDGKLLAQYSNRVKAHVLKTLKPQSPLYNHREELANPEYNVFYNAGTLIIVCAKPEGVHAEEDCSLAAQNLMLAAHAMGLGTCPIGFARPWLNLARTKRALAIPQDYTVVFPVIVGYPMGDRPPVARREPEIVSWR